MNAIQLLLAQTKDSFNWANKLIDTIPFEQWDDMPAFLQTNLCWQVGHLVVSFYYHSIVVIVGHQMDLLKELPLKRYAELFTAGSPETAVEQIDPAKLRTHLEIMQQRSVSVIGTLYAESLNNPLQSVLPAHPIAKNK